MAAAVAIGASLVLSGSLLAKDGDNGKGKGQGQGQGEGEGKKGSTPRLGSTIIISQEQGVFPEGIAAKGHWLYTGSTATGTIYRAHDRGKSHRGHSHKGSGAAQPLLKDASGPTSAVGMKIDKHGHLVVAGGGTGMAWIVDRHTGATLGKLRQPPEGRPPTGQYDGTKGTFLNDITIAKNGDAYITDSFSPTIWRIPASFLANPTMDGVLDPWLRLEGRDSIIAYKDGFNLNGIVSWKNKYLLVVQTNTGNLYRIRISTKQIVEVRDINIAGGDGMVLHDERLYVVNDGAVDVLKMKKRFTRAKLRQTISSATFDSPTTAALNHGRLYVVNSQFGEGAAAAPPWTISIVKPNGKR